MKEISMNNTPHGTIRTKIVCILDCPCCKAKLKLSEKVFDNNTVKGELLLYDGE